MKLPISYAFTAVQHRVLGAASVLRIELLSGIMFEPTIPRTLDF
jgi:hypothetical protein